MSCVLILQEVCALTRAGIRHRRTYVVRTIVLSNRKAQADAQLCLSIVVHLNSIHSAKRRSLLKFSRKIKELNSNKKGIELFAKNLKVFLLRIYHK